MTYETVGTSEARERLPHIVQNAELRGRITYITRRGAPGPVAAVVPMSAAQEPLPGSELPSAEGGAFTPDDADAERRWTSAALDGLQHHLTQVISAALAALSVVGEARTAQISGDLPLALEKAGSPVLGRAIDDLGNAQIEAMLMRDALADPGPAECVTCAGTLQRDPDGPTWYHVVQHPETGQWEQVSHLKPHTTVARHRPPKRPDIRSGQVHHLPEEGL